MRRQINIGLSRLGGAAMQVHNFKDLEARKEFVQALEKADNYEDLPKKAKAIVDEAIRKGKIKKTDPKYSPAFSEKK